MATLKQTTAFKKVLENIGNGNPQTAGEILVKSGYSKAISKNPKMVFESKGWQQLKKEAENQGIIKEIFDTYIEVLRGKDTRSRLLAAKDLATMFEMFPEQKTKIMGLFGNISSLEDSGALKDNTE